MSFLGLYRHAVDSKGRIAIPAAFRRDLAGAVIAPGPDGRLVIHPPASWAEYVARFQMTPASTPDQRLFSRHLFANAREVELDAQGRLLLTAEHRQFAGITDRAVVVGASNVVEIGNESAWDGEEEALTAARYSELADRVGGAAPAQ